VGGALRDALLGTLGHLKMDGQIRNFIAGEDWRISDESSWHLIQQHGELRRDSDLGKGNRGITIVVL
jgi:hypothetical protein